MNKNPQNQNACAKSLTLKSAGLKVTQARLALLKLLKNSHGPFTSEEIHSKLVEDHNSSLDLVTVYRNVTKLEQAGIHERSDFGDGSARYELRHIG